MARIDATIRRLQALTGWRRCGFALLLGVLLAAAQAPLYLWPLAFVALPLLLLLGEAAGNGWRHGLTVYVFAYGYFVAGLYWIGIAFFVDAAQFAWLSPLPVLGLPLLLAAFPAGGLWLARRLGGGGAWSLVLAAAGWTFGEWLRGFVLTGFPWNLLGYVWADHPPAMQAAALVGSHGLGALTFLAAAGLALALRPGSGRRARLAALLLPAGFALVVLAGQLRLVQAPERFVDGVQLRLVQPSIAQTLKWQPELRQKHLEQQIALSRRPAAVPPTHIVWSETAIPYLIDEAGALRQALAQLVPPQGALVAGAIRRRFGDDGGMIVYNSLFALNGAGNVANYYDKLHLVPFGEYLPLRRWLHPLGLDALAAGSVDFTAGESAAPLLLDGLPPARPLICYEAIFPAEIAGAGALRPGLLLNITNDAWFGHSSGPYQHFASARMRAVEQGLPLVRAANNGISAIVDPYGRVIASLGLDATGTVDGPLPAAIAAPLFAVWGDGPAVAAAVLATLVAAMIRRRRIKH
ncbi:apolipoprotein N-acyltransferase [Ferrovibrio sp.]|uniref:apolipoprotein N-acyltransferase n=1 Tax=Ferrovibrio sp. TaxID=1917215 RepID=UPI0035116B0E